MLKSRKLSELKSDAILNINIQSLSNKLDAVDFVLNNGKYKLACITEHWMTDNQLRGFNIQNYVVASSFSRKVFKHGGCLILARKDFQSGPETKTLNELSIEKHIEICAVLEKGTKIFYICIYRSPHGNFDLFIDQFEKALNIVSKQAHHNIVIAGDFNINFLERNNETRKIEEVLTSYGLHVVFKEASRKTQTSGTCIDNIFSDLNQNTHKTKTINYHISDHLAQRLDIQMTNACGKDKCRTVRIMNKENTRIFRERLENTDWSFIHNDSVHDSYRKFHVAIMNVYNDCFPEKKMTIRKSRPRRCWENAELTELKKKVDAAQTIYEVKRDEDSKRLYMELKKQFKVLITNVIRNEDKKLIDEAENKSQAIWRVINSKLKTKESAKSETLTEEDFNFYFSKVADKLIGSNNDRAKSDKFMKKKKIRNSCSLFISPTSPEEVMNVVSKMKKKSSQDIYGFSVRIVKEIIQCLAHPLSDLINRCFEQGYFPEELKVARVIPVHKKGDRDSLDNYRPISILPALSKIFESLLRKRLTAFLEGNSLLDNHQHGFRRGKSTTTALVQMIEFITTALDEEDEVKISCMDLSKAFDCVNHDILLRKLDNIGVRGPALNLIKSYLQDRYQVVDLEGTKSSKMKMTSGVPQGSMLGPILFLVYIDDLVSNVEADNELLFADDASFLNKSKNRHLLEDRSRRSVQEAIIWFTANNLKVNTDKTQELIVSTKHHNTKSISLLGMKIDGNLSWTLHIDVLCGKLSTSIFAIRRIRHILTEKEALLTYHTQFHSRMTYGIILWGASPEAERVFLKQKRALRALADVGQMTSCRPLFRRYNVLTVTGCYMLECLMYIHNNKHNFLKHSEVHNHNTRFKEKYITPKHRLQKTQNTHVFNGMRLYNNLPQRITSLDGKAFKKIMKHNLTERVVYTFDELLSCQF